MTSTAAERSESDATCLHRLLDIRGVAEILGTTERHVRRLVAERRIPYVKCGHFVRFDPTEIAHWLDNSRVSTVN